jgi:hypothetical protein
MAGRAKNVPNAEKVSKPAAARLRLHLAWRVAGDGWRVVWGL